jgi:hypothetical protein
MRRRRKAEHASERNGELLTFELEREDEPVAGPPPEREPVHKPFVVPFEALPAKTIVSRW